MAEADSKLIQLLEQLEHGSVEREEFIERLGEFEDQELLILQELLRILYRVKMVLEGPPPTWGISRPTGLRKPGTSGPGGRRGSGRSGTSRRGSK